MILIRSAMLVKRLILLILLCVGIALLRVEVYSAANSTKDGMDSTFQYVNETFRELGLDTAGSSYLTRLDVREFVWRSVDQLPSWVYGKERVDTVHVNSGTQVFFVDTLVERIAGIWLIDEDSIRVINQRPPPFWKADHPDGERSERADNDTYWYFYFFADSVYLYPTPVTPDSDTLRIMYYQQPVFSDTSYSGAIVMPRQFQLGVVYHAVYMAEIRLQRGKWKEAWERYQLWVQATKANVLQKPIDLFKNESLQR